MIYRVVSDLDIRGYEDVAFASQTLAITTLEADEDVMAMLSEMGLDTVQEAIHTGNISLFDMTLISE